VPSAGEAVHAVAGFFSWLIAVLWDKDNAVRLLPWITLVSVVLTIVATAIGQSRDRRYQDRVRRNASEEAKAAFDLAATTRFVGNARTVRSRLSIVYQLGGWPIDMYAPFDRLVDMCYSDDLAATLARRRTASTFYPELSKFEIATASMKYSLEKVDQLAKALAGPPAIESERETAILCARGAADALDTMRAGLGDLEPVPDVPFAEGDLARSVRRERARRVASSEDLP
jgi:hypothetical protein